MMHRADRAGRTKQDRSGACSSRRGQLPRTLESRSEAVLITRVMNRYNVGKLPSDLQEELEAELVPSE
jgi:hypothetical protein